MASSSGTGHDTALFTQTPPCECCGTIPCQKPADLPVAAPDPAATARRAAQWVEDRGVYLTPRGGLSPLPPGGADTRVVYAYADAFALALVALLAERQQDKERIERLTAIADAAKEVYGPGKGSVPVRTWAELGAALAVEEDATE